MPRDLGRYAFFVMLESTLDLISAQENIREFLAKESADEGERIKPGDIDWSVSIGES